MVENVSSKTVKKCTNCIFYAQCARCYIDPKQIFSIAQLTLKRLKLNIYTDTYFDPYCVSEVFMAYSTFTRTHQKSIIPPIALWMLLQFIHHYRGITLLSPSLIIPPIWTYTDTYIMNNTHKSDNHHNYPNLPSSQTCIPESPEGYCGNESDWSRFSRSKNSEELFFSY